MLKESARNIVLSGMIATSPISLEAQPIIPPDTENGPTVTAFVNTEEFNLNQERSEFTQVKNSIENFTWEDYENDKKLNKFIENLAQGYVDSTFESIHTKKELKNNTKIFRNYPDLEEEADKLSPEFQVPYEYVEIVYESLDDGKYKVHYLLNLDEIDSTLDRASEKPGYFLADRLFKAWMMEDAYYNDYEGSLISNPEFKIDELNGEELIGYFGGTIYAENENSSLGWFHENLAHAISARILIDKIGLDPYGSDFLNVIEDYAPLEAKILAEISIRQNVSVDELYYNYSVSNAEEIFKMIGRHMMYVDVENDELDRYKFDPDLYNGFRYAQVIDRGFEYPEPEIENPIPPDTTRTA